MQQSRTGSRKVGQYCFWLIGNPTSRETALRTRKRKNRHTVSPYRAVNHCRLMGRAQEMAERLCRSRYRAAVTMISTLYLAAASLTSTVARAGVLPGETQASHTPFISGKVFMSVR